MAVIGEERNRIRSGPVAIDVAAREAQVIGDGPRIEPLARDRFPGQAREDLRQMGQSIGRYSEIPEADYVVPPTIATMLRHPGLYRCQMELAIQLTRDSALSARERELAILRQAWLCQAPDIWAEHVANAHTGGFTAEEVDRITQGSDAPGWNEHERALLRAVEELIDQQCITDQTWAALARRWNDEQLMELPTLVGAYFMMALQQNSFRVPLPRDCRGLHER